MAVRAARTTDETRRLGRVLRSFRSLARTSRQEHHDRKRGPPSEAVERALQVPL